MAKETIYEPSKEIISNAVISKEEFEKLYQQSINNPEQFWEHQARNYLSWEQEWESVKDSDLVKGEISWFKGGKLNASVNCIDRHLEKNAEKIAIIWEGDDPKDSLKITYKQLHNSVCKFANALKKRGIGKGDRVCIYMPMIPEAAYAMLACARIGAIHSVVFGGFSPESLKDRILDSDCESVITADEGLRGSKRIPLKNNVDKALEDCPNVHSVFVIKRTNAKISWNENRDVDYQKIIESVNLIAKLNQWILKIPYLFFILLDLLVSLKEFFILLRAIFYRLLSLINWSLTIKIMKSIGVPQM